MNDGDKARKPSWLGRVFCQRPAEQAAIRREHFTHVMALARKVAADDPPAQHGALRRFVVSSFQAMTLATFRYAHGARGGGV
ncbi:hypothetical protein ACO0TC_19220 [Pseudomonas aeruginosa]|uniref:hypothetical protein n=1 Tax=Pseudomonas TaxID=286 RepID=UPI001FFC6D99|nr:hypothetical protein [Pseudomonas sp. PNPG3]MCK2119851.1 hypothetical protein [Pseudomonas sp. PNPG3]